MPSIDGNKVKSTNINGSSIDFHEHLVLTLGNIELKANSDLRIESQINNHARIFFTATIPSEIGDKESYIKELNSNSKIDVSIKQIRQLNQVLQQTLDKTKPEPANKTTSDAEQLTPFFKGLTTKIEVAKLSRDEFELKVEGVSYTYNLDIELRQRSYQNSKLTYAELVDQVLDNPKYASAKPKRFISDTIKNGPLGQMMVQYNETDWQFLVRMASQHNTGIVAKPITTDGEKPEFWFGVQKNDTEVTLEALHYKIYKKNDEYETLKQNKSVENLNEAEYLFYEIRDIHQYLSIGQAVNFYGKKLYVCQVTSRSAGHQLIHDYVLTSSDGMKQKKLFNPKLAGVSLNGTVIDRVQDEVKVHLAVDQVQKNEEAWLFPLTTPYAAEEHTGWYWMPEVGDQVTVYFPNTDEVKAYITNSVRKAGTGQTVDPDKKYLRNSRNKELLFDNKGITISTAKGSITETNAQTGKKTQKEVGSKLTLRLDQAAGIIIHSDNTLKVISNSDLTIDAKKLQISAGELLELKCQQSYVKMTGSIIQVEGTIIDTKKGNGSNVAKTAVKKEVAGIEVASAGNSLNSGVTSNTQKEETDKIIKVLKKKGYVIYDKPWILNIIGIRSKIRKANAFDDKMIVFYYDESGNKISKQYKITTDPGTKSLKDMVNPKGCAILKEGQYIDCWALGKHKGKYEALVQVGNMVVYRDKNKDNTINTSNISTEKGLFGINNHRANAARESVYVENWSAGCQVLANPVDFTNHMNDVKQQIRKTGKTRFTYTLLLEEDFVDIN